MYVKRMGIGAWVLDLLENKNMTVAVAVAY